MNKRMTKYVRIKTGKELYCHCQPRHQVLQLCCSHPEAAWQKDIKLVSLEKLRTELLQIFVQLGTRCRYTSKPRGLPDSICSSQPSIVHWLSSSIFPCLFVCLFVRPSVRPAMVTSDRISTFFNVLWYRRHILTQYHSIPSSTKLY